MCMHQEWREQRRRERERFLKKLKGCIKAYDDRRRLLVIGDMNTKVRDEVEGVAGKFGVSRMNENGRKLIKFCSERVWKMVFGKDIHKYTWASGVDGRISLLDLTVVQEEDRDKLLDVSVFRGA